MAVLKCKMCGGTLDIQEDMTVCECEYCGSKQTNHVEAIIHNMFERLIE